jgi:hypothetical protein
VQKPLFWIVLIALMYAGHQDVWFWRTARPLLAGFLPVGLTYHALYCLAASALMWALTTYAWPSHLEQVRTPGVNPAAGPHTGPSTHSGGPDARRDPRR